MSRTQAVLPGGPRLSDYLSIGVLAQVYPIAAVREALASCGRASLRQRALPAEAMVYYVVALGLFRSVSAREVLRCLMEGLRWVSSEATLHVSGKSSISRARTRLGSAPFEALRAARVGPVADAATRGSWYRGRRLVAQALDRTHGGLDRVKACLVDLLAACPQIPGPLTVEGPRRGGGETHAERDCSHSRHTRSRP